jgi:hypothetical protein
MQGEKEVRQDRYLSESHHTLSTTYWVMQLKCYIQSSPFRYQQIAQEASVSYLKQYDEIRLDGLKRTAMPVRI